MTDLANLNVLLRIEEEAYRYVYAFGGPAVATAVAFVLVAAWVGLRSLRGQVRTVGVPGLARAAHEPEPAALLLP